ncbi:MAG: 1-acyl-sn-glycerol-3-phosphate acyltransferase [Burkholderiales bacterium]|nr:1-acyl-sn-glycerol-3-phosphate acyltransferase [Burkholderiales bacterium]
MNLSFRWRQLAFGAVLGQLGASLLLLSCVARAVALVLPRAVAARTGRSIVSFIYRRCWASATRLGLMELDVEGLDALRSEPGGLLIAANHPTMLDAMLVVARLPRSVCIMRADLMQNVFLGPGARLASYIGNDSGRGMVRDSVAALREGQVVVLFPEGTRTSTPPVNAFKPGITLIAKLAQVPIQTVLIRSDSPFLRKGWPLLRAPPQRVRIRVTLGQRFPANDDRRAALQQIEAYFARELGTGPSPGAAALQASIAP